MKNSLLFKIAVVVFLFSLAGLFGWRWYLSRERNHVRFTINDKEYVGVVSASAQEIEQGLSGRLSIGADAMVFLMPQPAIHTFWMKGMRFPLDFIWVSEQKVVSVNENIPTPAWGASQEKIPTVKPESEAEVVLEVPAGFVAKNGVKKGDSVVFRSSFFPQLW